MKNSQQLFEINKRINQIKRDLQIRSDKANQWSVPYEKVLKKAQILQTTQGNFNKMQEQEIFETKQQKRNHLQQRVKQSRKKINNFHNQLKQLQQLQERKTKLYVKKQDPIQIKVQKQKNFDLRSSSMSNQHKTMNKTFKNSMIASGIFSKTVNYNNFSTTKDRMNPFMTMKPESIIQIFQQAKQLGKQNMVNQALGMGIEFTPYSHILKREKKDEELDHKVLVENNTLLINTKKDALFPNSNVIKKKNHLQKILGSKVSQQRQIYMIQPEKQSTKFRNSETRSKKPLNMFELRMKKLLEQTNTIENCQGNYLQLLKQQKRASRQTYCKTAIGKVRANNTYKTVFGGK